jgi:uncharacterized membrane protein YecN with MAPEG domain
MAFVVFVAALALIEYMAISLLTGRARGTYKVEAPATTGHPVFERWYRVQQNTVEQLVVFLPALFLFAGEVSPRMAGLIGLVFIIGRVVYTRSYIADPASRGTGFVIGFAANAVLVLGALFGAIF